MATNLKDRKPVQKDPEETTDGPWNSPRTLKLRASDWVRLLRPKQYSKNVFVFAGLLFTKAFSHYDLVLATVEAFLCMCLLGSATYIANDIIDVERDRAHPKKRFRPIASGRIKIVHAAACATALVILGLAIGLRVSIWVAECGVLYLGLQVLYNLKLKHVPIADVFVIAAGFVLRVVIGAVAISAALSGWILVCTASLALLLGFGKRRHEFLIQGDDRGRSRESLVGYTLQVLDAFVIASAAGAIMCYGVYGIESATARQYPALIVTIPFVAFGICRYLMLIFSTTDSGEPETLVLKDPQLVINFALFLLAAVYALSGARFSFIN